MDGDFDGDFDLSLGGLSCLLTLLDCSESERPQVGGGIHKHQRNQSVTVYI